MSQSEMTPPNTRLIFDRLPATLAQVGLHKTYWYKLISLNQAPQPVRIGKRTVVWERGELQAWMQSRLQARKESSGK